MDRNWDGKERRVDGVSIPYPLLGIMFTLVLAGQWVETNTGNAFERLNPNTKV